MLLSATATPNLTVSHASPCFPVLPLALSLRQNAVKKAGVRSVRSACGTTWSEVAKFADQDGWRWEQRNAQTDMERHQSSWWLGGDLEPRVEPNGRNYEVMKLIMQPSNIVYPIREAWFPGHLGRHLQHAFVKHGPWVSANFKRSELEGRHRWVIRMVSSDLGGSAPEENYPLIVKPVESAGSDGAPQRNILAEPSAFLRGPMCATRQPGETW